ncbi:MAG: ATP-binding protein [Pseudomonadota bacterium]
MSGGSDFFRIAQDSIEGAAAFWPSPHNRDVDAGDAALLAAREAEHGHAVGAAPDPRCLGRVVCVSGAQLVVCLENGENRGQADATPRKGGLVKIVGQHSVTYGIVTDLAIPLPGRGEGDAEVRLAELDLVGEATGKIGGGAPAFQRGVATHPALGDFVYAVGAEDLDLLFAVGDGQALPIGVQRQDPPCPAVLAADRLLDHHFAMLGAAGAGKSCGAAAVLRQLAKACPRVHVLILDGHNEYAAAFADKAEVIRPAEVQIPFWMLSGDEMCALLLGAAPHAARREAGALLKAAILHCRQAAAGHDQGGKAGARVSVDTPLPYGWQDLGSRIEAEARRGQSNDAALLAWLKGGLDEVRGDPSHGFLFGPAADEDGMADILARLLGMAGMGKPFTVLDLSTLSPEVAALIVAVVTRLVVDFGVWSNKAFPTLLVCEEAHRYASADGASGSGLAKEALVRLAQEGLQAGVSLCAISRHPAAIAPAVLAQCHTVFAFRMQKNEDQETVHSLMAGAALGLLDFLPVLGDREAIVVGAAAPLPQRVLFDALPAAAQPRRAPARAAQDEKIPAADPFLIAKAIARWRQQAR